MRFKGKVVLVTGSSRGIGKATALLFAKEGANVIVNYSKSRDEAEDAARRIEKLGSKAMVIKCDVSDEKQVKNMFEEVIKKFGRVDVLVNNAGVVFDVPLMERTREQWSRTLDVNLIGTFLCSKYAARCMLEQKYGKIVNISSTNAIDSFNPDAIDYDSSKAGVAIMTRDLAKGLAPHIQVNSIAPGWVDTAMNKNLPKDFIKKETEKIYLGRLAEPEEIAKAVLFLASDDASYITGSMLKVDGGYG
ncbi:MAG: SDR family oxidoreductase [Candidatus Aenigmarchaeota archaeon]|nr:SDR family oxidoreductase [Candidatus Aenigmarchaeota archaeon]